MSSVNILVQLIRSLSILLSLVQTDANCPPGGKQKPTKSISRKRQPSRGSLLTGRGVTTQMLIDEQILEAGEKCLTINYLVSIPDAQFMLQVLNLNFDFLMYFYGY